MPNTPPPPPPGGRRNDSEAEFEFSRDDSFDTPPYQLEDYERQARTWGMLCHLSALSAFVGVPLGHLAGPLIVWLIKRNEFPYVDEQGRESLNFQISMTLYGIVAAILMLVVVGIFLLMALGVFSLIAVIVASVRANDGRPIRYPLTIRFLR